MGVIQNAINQAIGTVGIAARLNPALEQRVQIRQGKKDIENLQVAAGKAQKLGQTDAAEAYEQQAVQKSQELVGKHPDAKGIKDVQKNLPMTWKEDPEVIAAEQAELQLQAKQLEAN